MEEPLRDQPVESEISLNDIWNIIKRRWFLIFIITLLFAVSSYAYVNQLTPLYRSTATLIIQNPSSSSSMMANPIPDFYISERWAQTYAEMIKAEPVLQEVSKRILYPKISAGEIRGGLNIEVVRDTLLLRVSYTYYNENYTKKITDTVCEVFIESINDFYRSNIQSSAARLENQISILDTEIEALIVEISQVASIKEEYDVKKEDLERKQELRSLLIRNYEAQKLTESQLYPNVKIFQEGTNPGGPINKRTEQTMAIGILLGLFVSLLISFFLEYLDDTIKTEDDLKKVSHRRILGVIPRFDTKSEAYYLGKYSRSYLKD